MAGEGKQNNFRNFKVFLSNSWNLLVYIKLSSSHIVNAKNVKMIFLIWSFWTQVWLLCFLFRVVSELRFLNTEVWLFLYSELSQSWVFWNLKFDFLFFQSWDSSDCYCCSVSCGAKTVPRIDFGNFISEENYLKGDFICKEEFIKSYLNRVSSE